MDIEFGDVQEAKPETSLRPDRNAHFAVVKYQEPAAGEIPVFLDFDVMLDMEVHAASDKTVELGGVMLGGQFEDEHGQPFVVITDTLRAKHYESTKGSFKFTKEAWTEITKERNEYSPDLQMVGWYHTHPDWGVFLSGMDMFICDNFFNRPLDMAYVIDPCRGDRAFFQWTKSERDRCKRQQGFYVMTSRLRAAELSSTVAQLQEGGFMPADNRQSGFGGMGAPVINVSAPPPASQQPNVAVLGMLAVQVCLLALLVWKLVLPASSSTAETELANITKQLKEIAAHEEGERTQKAVVKALDAALAQGPGMEPGTFEKLTELQLRNEELTSAQLGHGENAKRLTTDLAIVTKQAKEREEELKQTLKEHYAQRLEWKEEKDKLTNELAAAKPKKKEGESEEEAAASWTWYWVGGVALCLAAFGGIAATLAYKPTRQEDLENERLASRPMVPPPERTERPDHRPEPTHLTVENITEKGP
jgi:proteasome lid subunit RPN8/RPN11